MNSGDLLERVLELEWWMFVRVRSANPAPCQSAPNSFRAIRGSLFAIWSDAMLASYLEDLRAAAAQGRNLLAQKYARMDGIIPPLTTSPLIGEIVAVESGWQAELRERYPALFRHCCRPQNPTGDGRDFSVYLACELETYGARTLALYHAHVMAACARDRNLAIDALAALVRSSGYGSIDHGERCLAARETS